jgi:hypothetical protein
MPLSPLKKRGLSFRNAFNFVQRCVSGFSHCFDVFTDLGDQIRVLATALRSSGDRYLKTAPTDNQESDDEGRS